MIQPSPLITAATLLLGSAFANLLPAQYTEDRDNRTPVSGRYWYYNATTTTLSSIAASNRIVDLEVTQTSPSFRFTVSYLKNTGGFAKTWWYFYGWSSTTLASALSSRKSRLTDLEVYNTSSGLRFSGLMEANSTNGKVWWWYYNSSVAGIMAQASSNGARVVDIEQYTVGSSTYYAAILLKNTGKDAKGWWMYVNVTSSTLQALLTTNKARVWDFDRLSNGRYNVVMTKWSGEQAWHWYGQTAAQVNTRVLQYGARLIDIQQYNTSGGLRFDIALLNSCNALSARVRDMMLSRSNGAMGFHLRRVPLTGSSYELAGINQNTRFEPASTLKTLHHVTTMRDVYLRKTYLSTLYSVKYWTPTGSGSCPKTRSPYTIKLQAILEDMMRNSNNSYTKVITDKYGMSGLTNSAKSIGMSNTAINRHMGCSPLTNYSTLNDLATLHERVIKGYLGSERTNFYTIMNNGVWTSLRNVVNQEASKLSMSGSQANSFVNNMQFTGKGGNDTVGSNNTWTWYAYLKLPYWRNGGMSTKEYSYGAWVNYSTSSSNARDAVNTASVEILRDEIRACLLTLKNHVFGGFTPFGSSCGGKFAPLTHDATGTPELGQKIYFRINGSRSGSHLTSLKIGLSKSTWGGVPLPLHLSFLGAPNCYWRTDSLIEVVLTAVNGKAAIPATLPYDKSLINVQVHSQYLTAEPGANAAGLTATNGITTKIGGQK